MPFRSNPLSLSFFSFFLQVFTVIEYFSFSFTPSTSFLGCGKTLGGLTNPRERLSSLLETVPSSGTNHGDLSLWGQPLKELPNCLLLFESLAASLESQRGGFNVAGAKILGTARMIVRECFCVSGRLEEKGVKSVLRNALLSHHDYFTRPRGWLVGFSRVFLQLTLQKSCHPPSTTVKTS